MAGAGLPPTGRHPLRGEDQDEGQQGPETEADQRSHPGLVSIRSPASPFPNADKEAALVDLIHGRNSLRVPDP